MSTPIYRRGTNVYNLNCDHDSTPYTIKSLKIVEEAQCVVHIRPDQTTYDLHTYRCSVSFANGESHNLAVTEELITGLIEYCNKPKPQFDEMLFTL